MHMPAAIFTVSRVIFRRALPFLCLLGLIFPGGIRAEDPPVDQAFLFSTQWSAAAYSEKASGAVCWIEGADGSLRVEALRDDKPRTEAALDLTPLLDRTGTGWTLVVGPDQTGTVNAWGREWRQVPAGLAQLVRLVTASVRAYPDPPVRFPFAIPVGDHPFAAGILRPCVLAVSRLDPGQADTRRYQLAPLVMEEDQQPAVRSFRRKMTARGRGTGGVGEILILRWERSAHGDGYGLGLTSSRRPGKLNLAPAGRLSVLPPEPELFLPLWPMSQFFQAQ